MYLSHFKFRCRPFDISPDPDFLWLGENHTEALSTLKYGILEDKGFLLLTGEIGTGKTAIINLLIREIDVAAIVATVPDPGLEPLDFFNFLAEQFKMNRRFASKADFLIELKQFLLQAYFAQQKVLLIIDEAQRLNPEMLEQIRLLSNIELSNRKLINIFFVGQSEFTRTLLDERSKAVRQRIAISYHIEPLTETETEEYIQHRLKVAGAQREIFSPAALDRIHVFTGGRPRLINIVCDHALITAFAKGSDIVGPQIIEECCKELRITISESAAEDKKPAPTSKSDAGAARLVPALHPSPTVRGRGKRWLHAGVMCALAALLLWGGLQGMLGPIADRINGTEVAHPSSGAENGASHPITRPLPQGIPTPSLSQPRESSADSEQSSIDAIRNGQKDATVQAPETLSLPQDRRTQSPNPINAPPPSAPLKTPDAYSSQETRASLQHRNSGTKVAKEFTLSFEGSSTNLPVDAEELLSDISSLLNGVPETRVVIEGHTNSNGDLSSNRVVSYARAAAVRDYFLDKGIEPRRLKMFAFGAERPIDSNLTPGGRSKNSRVAIRIFTETAIGTRPSPERRVTVGGPPQHQGG